MNKLNTYLPLMLLFTAFLTALAGCSTPDSEEPFSLIDATLRAKIESSGDHISVHPEILHIKQPQKTEKLFLGIKNPFNEAVSARITPYCEDAKGNAKQIIEKQFVNLGPNDTHTIILSAGSADNKYYFCTITVQMKDIQEKVHINLDYA